MKDYFNKIPYLKDILDNDWSNKKIIIYKPTSCGPTICNNFIEVNEVKKDE